MDTPVSPTYIQLSILDYQDTYDINTKIPVSISVIPEDADTNAFEYISSGNALIFSDTGIITSSEEGSFDIYVKSGNITSNTLTINVQSNNAPKKDTNEKLAKSETAKQKIPEEQDTKEAEQQ